MRSEDNPDAVQAAQKKSYHKHKPKRLAAWNRWMRANPEKRRERNRKYARPAQRKRLKIDGFYRALCVFRARFSRALKSKKGGRRMFEMLGYTKADLKEHLEAHFQLGMAWENYGKEWHVDHVRPLASFDWEDTSSYRGCWALSNLQPLWKADNLKKYSVWNGTKWRKGKAITNALDLAYPAPSEGVCP